MNRIKLQCPSIAYGEEIMAFRQELLDTGSDFAGCGSLRGCSTAKEWIEIAVENKNAVQEGSVPSDSYLAIESESGRMVGIIDLRHHINHPVLGLRGGHIGYTVRPSERRKGYAKEMLGLCLINCRNRGLDKVLIVCGSSNIASEKTIIANGGVFEKEIDVDGTGMKRYWIYLEQ